MQENGDKEHENEQKYFPTHSRFSVNQWPMYVE